jgi:hypothetical protein
MNDVHKLVDSVDRNIKQKDPSKIKKVGRKYLINKLNYHNFQNTPIIINLKHPKFKSTLSLRADPLPCFGDKLECVWKDKNNHQEIEQYTFHNAYVPDDSKLLSIKPDKVRFDQDGIRFNIPETCDEIDSRETTRYPCEGMHVLLIQNSAVFNGFLIDFSATCFHVQLEATPPHTFQWLDPESSVNLVISNTQEMLYSEECTIIKQHQNKTGHFIIKSSKHLTRRFQPKEFRSMRQQLVPSPDIVFQHPFTKKINRLKVVDISGSGFSVKEDRNKAVLLPGMIIPELELNFANSFKILCKAQVIYKNNSSDNGNKNQVKCGLALLDMDIDSHRKLLALLHQASDEKAYLSNSVDLDALWQFFFESNLIYPEKYAFLNENKEQIKETYRVLYTRNPHIARHFIYQQEGRILGHMATTRFYENSWLIHHHAARSSKSIRAGLVVLNQIGRFINDSSNLYSIHMNYTFCHFRPENKFPCRVFGGIAENIKNPKGCSLDTFGYLHYRKEGNPKTTMWEPWCLKETNPEDNDLDQLERYYENVSGGLLLDALELKPNLILQDKLPLEYQRIGFKRERYVFSLKRDGRLKAIINLNLSNIGLNMSDLTNCIQIFVIDPEDFSKDIFFLTLSLLSSKFKQDDITVLLYPQSYFENLSIKLEKLYTLWVLNVQNHTDHYFRYLKKMFRSVQH